MRHKKRTYNVERSVCVCVCVFHFSKFSVGFKQMWYFGGKEMLTLHEDVQGARTYVLAVMYFRGFLNLDSASFQRKLKTQCTVTFDSHRTQQGRAMAQAVSRRPLTAEARVRARVNPCGICGGQSGTGQVLSEYFGFPCKFILPLLHIHLSPPHEVCDCSDQAAHYHNLGPQLGA
jgi:hypothetical protein